jgi:NUDIX domain
MNMVKYYKGKCYFEEKVQGQAIKARTACLILRFKDENQNNVVLTIRESPKKNILEFPGGKVEVADRSIHDTLLRESWEEIILKDDFGNNALQNWRSIYTDIVDNVNIFNSASSADEKFFVWLESQLSRCQTTTYGNCPLRTIYYIVDITKEQADYLIKTHSMIPFAVDFMISTVAANRKKSKDKRFTRRNTHFCIGSEIYRLRGRDFEGMFKFSSILEKPAKKYIDWSTCKSPKASYSNYVTTVVQ